MKLFIILIGFILVLEGLPYAAFPEAMQRWLAQLTELPPGQVRVIGLTSMIAGFAILLAARHFGLLG
ncbi:MAG: hypothetical protein Kow0089_12920 [Desulfobulbaceae bacterium]